MSFPIRSKALEYHQIRVDFWVHEGVLASVLNRSARIIKLVIVFTNATMKRNTPVVGEEHLKSLGTNLLLLALCIVKNNSTTFG